MSNDSTANLGYGFKITNKVLCDKINCEDDSVVGKDFEITWSGDSYDEEGQETLLCIKKSLVTVYLWQGLKSPLKPASLVADPEWDAKLLAWCKEHKISKPKIGWWLTVSV